MLLRSTIHKGKLESINETCLQKCMHSSAWRAGGDGGVVTSRQEETDRNDDEDLEEGGRTGTRLAACKDRQGVEPLRRHDTLYSSVNTSCQLTEQLVL